MFEWNDYIKLGESLASSQDEAALRTAISRAYYAAFHRAIDICRELRIPVDRPTRDAARDQSVHTRVIRALITRTSPRLRNAGKALESLRKLRNDADYRLPFDGDVPAAAQKAIRGAHRVVDGIDTFRRTG